MTERNPQGVAQVGERLRHKQSGRVGTYVEHWNVGEGYAVRLDGGGLLHGPYDAFEPMSE